MQKGMAASFFLSIIRTFECIVNALFCCLDIDMTNNLGFTLSRNMKKSVFFCFLEKKKNFRENVWCIEKSCIFAAANRKIQRS